MALAAAARQPGAAAAQRFYRPELDMLRLLAFLMVWAAHALLAFDGHLPRPLLVTLEGAGSCGVPVFFFLSAFLITELLRRERQRTGTVQLRSFYVRRMLRIWPLYLGILLIYGLLGLHWHGFRIEPGRLLASVLLAGNWYIVFHPTITTPMRALWSVSVEEQWYLLWPRFCRGLSRRHLLAACILIIAGAQGLLALLAHHAPGRLLGVTAWDNSGVQFQFFALGAAAALLLDGRVPHMRPSVRVLLSAAGAASMLLAAGVCRIKEMGIPHSAASLMTGYAGAGAGAACLFFAVYGIAPQRCPAFSVRLGQLSFGLYVFHETGFFLANAAARRFLWPQTLFNLAAEKLLALAVAVLLAFVSYHLWERPFLRWKQRWAVVRSGAVS